MTKSSISHKQERSLLHAFFFLFGLGIMAWVPRFPELKAQLGLDNGAFGSLMSTGAIGAFVGLLITGHVIHKIGIYSVMHAAIAIMLGSLALIVHIHSSFAFFFLNICIGFGITTLHVSSNAQAFHLQDRSGASLVTSVSGYWAAGALLTSIISGIMVGRVVLATHIDILEVICYLGMFSILLKLRPVLVKANTNPEMQSKAIDIFKSFHLDWPVSLAMLGVTYLETCIGDWGTIFTKERLGIHSGLSALPYTLFLGAMIVVRLSSDKMAARQPLHYWFSRGTLIAGIGFGGLIAAAVNLPESQRKLSYIFIICSFLCAAVGIASLGPNLMRVANRRSPNSSAVVIGQLGATNNVLTFITKWAVAWTIQFTSSIAIAMAIPTALILSAYFVAHVTKED